jgi:hypothetical protein
MLRESGAPWIDGLGELSAAVPEWLMMFDMLTEGSAPLYGRARMGCAFTLGRSRASAYSLVRWGHVVSGVWRTSVDWAALEGSASGSAIERDLALICRARSQTSASVPAE